MEYFRLLWQAAELTGHDVFDSLWTKLGMDPADLSPDTYRKLAWLTFWFHMFWILILIGGMALCQIWPWYKPIHSVVTVGTIIAQVFWLGCPLTTLEQFFRRKANPNTSGYTGSFTASLFKKLFGFHVPSWAVIGTLVIALAISTYLVIK